MDLANTLLLCFICAGLTYLHNIISQRLRIRAHGCKCLIPALSQRKYYKEHLDLAAAAQPVVPASPSLCHVPALGGPHNTMDDNGNFNYVCSYISSSSCRLVDERDDMGDMDSTCSTGASASSSQSSSHADSDRDSDGRSFLSSSDWSDDDRLAGGYKTCSLHSLHGLHTPSLMILDPRGEQLRPAGRLPRRSALSQPKAAGEGRCKAKSVTFQTSGAIICSAPTVEVLGLMAAGTPPLPVTPCSFASCCISGGAIAPAPIANADLAQAICTMETDASVSNSSGRCPSSSFITSFGGNTPFLTAAPKSGQPVDGRVKQEYRLVSPLLWRTPPVAAFGSEGGLLCTDSVHALALAHAAAGRRRVMAALEEARKRFSHLSRSQLPNSWPSTTTGISTAAQELQFKRPGCSREVASGSRCLDQGSEVHRLMVAPPARLLPNLPLAPRDMDILSVGYAASIGVVPCEASTSVPKVPEAQQGCAGKYEIGVRDGGDSDGRQCANAATVGSAHMAESMIVGFWGCPPKRLASLDGVVTLRGGCFVALSQLTAANRLRMAEAVAKQLY
ncbi:hypothetical protein Vafri_13051 [Volvox africanus]|uniref:Uncharacterized protein n=1 Tax=Volvox africanus TaxID=51714 RepID=A0A8J4BAY6_9CHLO|nr:hypothetical protein Vafri_13051 [Volvox africanus]